MSESAGRPRVLCIKHVQRQHQSRSLSRLQHEGGDTGGGKDTDGGSSDHGALCFVSRARYRKTKKLTASSPSVEVASPSVPVASLLSLPSVEVLSPPSLVVTVTVSEEVAVPALEVAEPIAEVTELKPEVREPTAEVREPRPELMESPMPPEVLLRVVTTVVPSEVMVLTRPPAPPLPPLLVAVGEAVLEPEPEAPPSVAVDEPSVIATPALLQRATPAWTARWASCPPQVDSAQSRRPMMNMLLWQRQPTSLAEQSGISSVPWLLSMSWPHWAC